MDLNELRGRVLKVNIARPIKAAMQPGTGNRASKWFISQSLPANGHRLPLVWESEEWLRQYAKPLAQSGGKPLLTSQPAISQSSVQVFKDGTHNEKLIMQAMHKLGSLLMPIMRMQWKNNVLLSTPPHSLPCSLDANV